MPILSSAATTQATGSPAAKQEHADAGRASQASSHDSRQQRSNKDGQSSGDTSYRSWPGQSYPSYNGLAKTPPMGFNDWAQYRCNINEDLFVRTAKALKSRGLAKLGYKYVNIDDCWMKDHRDAKGNLVVRKELFPHGMKWLSDYLHNKGLKFGIYEDAGYQTCQEAPGSYGHFQQDANLYASWGVDYLKLDYCYKPNDKYPNKSSAEVAKIVYTKASKALRKTGRPIVFSESAPAYYNGKPAFWKIMKWIGHQGNLWRVGTDIQDNWSSVITNYSQTVPTRVAKYAGPGHWNDADMLEVGNPGLNYTEQKSQFSLWSEMASPLLISTDIASLSPKTLGILSNQDVIAVDQDPLGVQGTIAKKESNVDILSKPLSNGDRAVVFFNKGDSKTSASITAAHAGLGKADQYRLKDLWSKKTSKTSGSIKAHNIPSHGVIMYRVSSVGAHHT